MSGIVMLQGLPNNVPFVPQVEVRDNLRQYLPRITGEVMLFMQQQGITNTIVNAFYQLIGQNGFNNQAFVTLVQEVVIGIDYIVSVVSPGQHIDASLQENIATIVNGAAASYATKQPQVMQSLQTQTLQLFAQQAAATYNQLMNSAKGWFQGAKMNPYPMYPQQPQMYGQPQMMPQPQMMAPMMMQPGYAPAYAGAAMAAPAPYNGMPVYGQQPAMYGQQPRMNPQQGYGQPYQPQTGFVAAAPAGAGYVPQVAGGMFNPNAVAQPYYGQAAPQYGFSAPSSGPRTGGLGQAIPGVSQSNPQQYQEQNNYQPQAAVAQNIVPAYQQQPNLNQPNVVGQNLPPQPVSPVAAVAVPQQQQTVAQATQEQPVMTAPQPVAQTIIPHATAPNEVIGQQTVQPQSQAVSIEAAASGQAPAGALVLANESTRYRISNGSGYTRLPFVYDYTTEKHLVRLNANGDVIEQQVIDKDQQVELNDHKTTPYFIARTKEDQVLPNLKVFNDILDRAGTEIAISDILNRIAALQDKDEEEINKEVAVILRDSLSDKLVVINKTFYGKAENKVSYHEQFRGIAGIGAIANKAAEVAATFRHVAVSSFTMQGKAAAIAHRITMSEGLADLHQFFTSLIDHIPAIQASPLIDSVTDFVNVEMKRYFGLDIKMSSFVIDMMDAISIIIEEESPEFAGVVSSHLHERLTSTILYAYTPAELNEVLRENVYDEGDYRLFARVEQVVILPVRSRDVPYTYNGRAGLILATEYASLNRMIQCTFEMAGTHVAELKLVTLDSDVIHIHPIMNDGSYVMFGNDEHRQ